MPYSYHCFRVYILLQHNVTTLVILHLITAQSCFTGYYLCNDLKWCCRTGYITSLTTLCFKKLQNNHSSTFVLQQDVK
jgi:hypothetical protein